MLSTVPFDFSRSRTNVEKGIYVQNINSQNQLKQQQFLPSSQEPEEVLPALTSFTKTTKSIRQLKHMFWLPLHCSAASCAILSKPPHFSKPPLIKHKHILSTQSLTGWFGNLWWESCLAPRSAVCSVTSQCISAKRGWFPTSPPRNNNI